MPKSIGRARQYRNVAYTLRRIARDCSDQAVSAAAVEVARDYERMAVDLEGAGKRHNKDFPDHQSPHR